MDWVDSIYEGNIIQNEQGKTGGFYYLNNLTTTMRFTQREKRSRFVYTPTSATNEPETKQKEDFGKGR